MAYTNGCEALTDDKHKQYTVQDMNNHNHTNAFTHVYRATTTTAAACIIL